MKRKKLSRIKWLFTILMIVMLLNVALLLLPAILESKNAPEPDGTDSFVEKDWGVSVGEGVSGSGSVSDGEGMSSGGNLLDSDEAIISENENFANSVENNVLGKGNGVDSSGMDIPEDGKLTSSVENNVLGKENGADSSMADIPEDGKLTGSVENNVLGKENGMNSSKVDISEVGELTSSVENDIWGKENEIAPSGKPISNAENWSNSSKEDTHKDSDLTDNSAPETSSKEDATNFAENTILPSFDNTQGATANIQIPNIIPSEKSDDNTVTLCLMGDLMCLAGQQYTAERRDGPHDYTGSFYLLRDTFSSCDFVIGNLETTLSESNPYSTKEREVNEQPNCNAPADYLASLKWAGITHLVTANNHSLDGGLIGIEETIAHLEEYGIPHTGTYRTDYSGARYLMFEKNGIRIALLCFTELINQRALVTASQLSHIIDSYSRADAEKRIAQARADGADFVIVYEHWGSENVHDVRAYQKSHAKEIAEAGADLIIGSHPHCLQEMEMIATQDGRSVPCFYSLGNVVSSMTRDINHDTVFVLVQLQRNVGEVRAQATELHTKQLPQQDDEQATESHTEQFPRQDLEQATEAHTEKLPQQDDAKTPEHEAQSHAEQPPQPDTVEAREAEQVSITSLSLLACHVLTSFDGHYRVITPVNYPTDDKKAAAELAEAKKRIEEIFPSVY